MTDKEKLAKFSRSFENKSKVDTDEIIRELRGKTSKELAIEKLDELQRAISVRKVEISEICHHEKMPKPSFNDLNWVIEQIYWMKKAL